MGKVFMLLDPAKHLRWETGWADVLVELNLLRQSDKGNIILKILWVPVRVGEPFVRSDLHTVGFRTCTNIVSSS